MSMIPTTYRTLIDPLIDVARGILESGEHLVPVAFVGNLTSGQTHQVMMSAASESAKDESAELVRHLAALHEADFVFVIMDAWGLPRAKMHRYKEILERYGSIGASPYRVDIVSFTLETRHGLWVAQMQVKPKGVSKKRRTFGEPAFELFTEAQGRFVHLLPESEAGEAPSGVLH
ncbi:hypothetical protein [uncultured Thiodictyon sp.]|jgi:hypothetical protein|uniref:hypothetical protein n=1 Tax=uncultured Thiodictyon sp. TaxID=1846217 RepID=UPI0025F9BBD5|nr:hypothetical protein [uncultured Thiodictyon sp.]